MERLAVFVDAANNHEEKHRESANHQQPTSTHLELNIFLIESAKGIARSHHANPRNQWVEHEDDGTWETRSDGENCLLVKQHPEFCAPTRNGSLRSTPQWQVVSIEQIVKRDHQHTEAGDDLQRQVNQRRQNDHRNTNHKDNLHQGDEPGIDTEERAESNNGKLQHDQPKSARDEKTRKLAFALAAGKLQICSRAREKNKNRRAEVRNPAR